MAPFLITPSLPSRTQILAVPTQNKFFWPFISHVLKIYQKLPISSSQHQNAQFRFFFNCALSHLPIPRSFKGLDAFLIYKFRISFLYLLFRGDDGCDQMKILDRC
jgi:hypothetical protein